MEIRPMSGRTMHAQEMIRFNQEQPSYERNLPRAKGIFISFRQVRTSIAQIVDAQVKKKPSLFHPQS